MSGTEATARREPPVVFVPNDPPEPLLVAEPDRFGAVLESRALLAWRERVYLYAAVFARAPERCLEIGVFEGFSSKIIHAGMRSKRPVSVSRWAKLRTGVSWGAGGSSLVNRRPF